MRPQWQLSQHSTTHAVCPPPLSLVCASSPNKAQTPPFATGPHDPSNATPLPTHPPLPHAGEEVQQWLLQDSHQPPDQLDCTASAGFVKHAFTLAFCHLRRRSPFEASILQTLCRGGDTDTNAAIVGGMVGALHGAAAIPAWMTQPVLEYEGREDQGGGTPRPRELRASCLPDLAQQLFQLAGR